LAKLRPQIRKLCVVRTYTDIEGVVIVFTKIERVGKLEETPYKPMKKNKMKKHLKNPPQIDNSMF